MDEIGRQRQFEDQFLSQIRARASALTRGVLPADRVLFDRMPDGVDGVRAVLTRMEVFDRDLLQKLPGTQTLQMRFQRAVLGGLLRPTVSRVRAQVLSPTETLVAGAAPGPVDREHVLDALARYELLPKGERPTGVVFASPTGFSADAKSLVTTYGPPTVILMGGRADGGWDVTMPESVERSPWSKLFELESQDDLLNRMMHHLDQSELVDSRGISVAELSAKLGVDKARTEALVRRACRARSRLMTVVHEGQVHVCRTPLAEEGNAMSMWSRIRRLLRLKPTVAERVRTLTAQRVKLEQQRHEIDRRVDALEAEEVHCVKQGAAATTAVEKKQLAAKMIRLRRDLGRQKAQAGMLTKQIDILGTHVHHMTLTERGKRMELPKAEELTQEAAQAEQMMAELTVNAELATGIELRGESAGTSDEEAAIMAEFEAAASAAANLPSQAGAEQAKPAAARESGRAGAETPPEPPMRSKRSEPAQREPG
jgi:hypothetical protein